MGNPLVLICSAPHKIEDAEEKDICDSHDIVIFEHSFPSAWCHVVAQNEELARLVEAALRAAHFRIFPLECQPSKVVTVLRLRKKVRTKDYYAFDQLPENLRCRTEIKIPAISNKYSQWGKIAFFLHNGANEIAEALAKVGIKSVAHECCKSSFLLP